MGNPETFPIFRVYNNTLIFFNNLINLIIFYEI